MIWSSLEQPERYLLWTKAALEAEAGTTVITAPGQDGNFMRSECTAKAKNAVSACATNTACFFMWEAFDLACARLDINCYTKNTKALHVGIN